MLTNLHKIVLNCTLSVVVHFHKLGCTKTKCEMYRSPQEPRPLFQLDLDANPSLEKNFHTKFACQIDCTKRFSVKANDILSITLQIRQIVMIWFKMTILA